jgi:LCP family protein required for cell wall assembly
MYKKSHKTRNILLGIAIFFLTVCCLSYLLIYLPKSNVPFAEGLDIGSTEQGSGSVLNIGNDANPSFFDLVTSNIIEPLKQWVKNLGKSDRPLCGKDREWIVLLTGIDYRNGDYLYGLADVIRVARVDFTKPQVNIVAIPRNLLVNPPARLAVDGPLLLNQAYFFGTEGMGYYEGSGFGAGSLAETIHDSFGVTPQHYVVVNFQAFAGFIDAIGGIEVDLPEAVDNLPDSFFPAGVQTLNGEQALALGRIRKKYSDLTRINNQTIILKGIFARLKNPAVLTKLPEIYQTLVESVITDVTPSQINTLICLLPKTNAEDLHFYEPPQDLLTSDNVYIPNLDTEMQIFRWDQGFVDWMQQSLSEEFTGK